MRKKAVSRQVEYTRLKESELALSKVAQRAEETAMSEGKDIILAVDYHAENIEYRWFNEATGEERTGKYATSRAGILRQVEQSIGELAPGGRVVWIMESTTGWARVRDLLGERVRFILANVLQMPLPPKARRRKSDKIDTGRILREYESGKLPQSFQPSLWWRQVRRVVDCRQDLVERQTAIKNWIGSLLHHETWYDRENLWSAKGQGRLRAMRFSASDRMLVDMRVGQLEEVKKHLVTVEAQMQVIYDGWPEAQWVDAVRGIGMVTAVSILAHIGSIRRFATADDLIAYAGLAPGFWQSDGTIRHGRIGGGGTDSHLRYMLIEATTWLCQIPRYRATYERVLKKRGKKIARIVVARMLLRSIHKMLTERVEFNPAPVVRPAPSGKSNDAFIAPGLPAGMEKAPSQPEPSRCIAAGRSLGSRTGCPVFPVGRCSVAKVTI